MSGDKNADGQAGQEVTPAPSQEGHAAGPACSAPDEALIDNIWHQHTDGMGVYMTYKQFHRAIREYIRRRAGKEKG